MKRMSAVKVTNIIYYLHTSFKIFAISGLPVNSATSSKYVLEMLKGFPVRLGIYFSINLCGSILFTSIAFCKAVRKGPIPDLRYVLWNGTSMPCNGTAAFVRLSSWGCGFVRA